MDKTKCQFYAITHRAIQNIILVFYWHHKGKHSNSYNLHYLSYENHISEDGIYILHTYIYIYTCTHIYIRVSMHTCEYISLLSQQKRLYSDFKQNFTSTVESHVLILKPTITLSWFFFSKWFFHNSMKQPLQRQGSDI